MTRQQFANVQASIRAFLTDPNTVRELREGIARKERLIRDCLDRKPSLALREISEAWAGTPQIDFDYVASIVRYELQEDRQNLANCEEAIAISRNRTRTTDHTPELLT